MAVDIDSDEGRLIRKLVPFITMSSTSFNAICAKLWVEELTDEALFKKGDVDSNLFYLLSGEVNLQAEGFFIETISADSEAAKFALAHQIPRKIDAVAKGTVRFFRLDADRVNNPPAFEYKEEPSYMIYDEPEDDSGDWMTALLRHPIFHRLPPANLQKILISLELVEVEKGSIIIEQGAPGDYYYLLKSGQCLITRKPAPNMKEIKLGLLEKGETFGEDSLITGTPRTVNVTAMTDVSLLRLNKEQFVSLIKEPTLKYINYEDLDNAIQQGSALLDIRTPDEYEKRHIEGSVNVPYFSLRMQFKNLSRDKMAIVICDDGRASEAGAFLLLKNNFNAYILRDGMQSVLLEQKNESAEFAIDDGIETLTQIYDAEVNENRVEEADVFLQESPKTHMDDQIRLLNSEIDVLRRINQQLNEKCMKLEIEKESISRHFRAILQQLEVMKKQVKTLNRN